MISLRASLRTWHLAGALLLAMPQAASAQAPQPWPERTIQAIVPFARRRGQRHRRADRARAGLEAGQPADRGREPSGRGRHASASRRSRKAQPNGYTLLVHSSSFSAAYSLYKSLPYDTLNDFTAVVALGKTPTVLVTSPGKGFKTAGDLIAAARAKPGAMNFASAGHRLGVPSRRRALSPERRDRRPAHPVPRPERSLHRGDGGADRFLFPAARAGAAAGQGRATDGARRKHRYAGDRAPRRADHDGAWS